MSFPALVTPRPTPPDREENAGTGPRIGTVKYWFDPGKKAWLRREWPFPEKEPASEGAEELLPHVESIGLQYYAPAKRGKGGTWQEYWNDETNHPSRVRMRLAFVRDEQVVNIARTVLLQVERPGTRGRR